MLYVLAVLLVLIFYISVHTFYLKQSTYHIPTRIPDSITLVHISDLHGTTRFMNGPLSAHINKLNPDIVCITGDLSNHHRELPKVIKELKKINCKCIYFVPGNHEREETAGPFRKQQMKVSYRSFIPENIHVMENEYEIVMIGNTKVLIYGFDNSIYGNERYDRGAEQNEQDFTVFLAHSPNIIRLIERESLSYNLLLCGHTHGGQIRFFNRSIGGYRHFHIGLKQLRGNRYFGITRGLGEARIPIRHACFPEIAVYEIKEA